MQADFDNIFKSLDTLTIEQVAERIYAKDPETARKWLIKKGIEIHKYPSHSYVFQIEVDSHLDKPFVQGLRSKYPDKWKDRYRQVVKDIAVYKLTVSMLEDEKPSIPKSSIKEISKKDQERYNRFIR